MSSKQDNTNLYRVLERGDRKIQSAHESAIVLVGLTRAGKSTTFNWTLGKHLIGVGEEFDAHYENVLDEDKEAAQLGDTITSVTLCPNIVELDKQNKVTLIDMAGYKDKRDYIGVLGVSYFLKAVFEKIKKVKFIVVLGEDILIQTSGDGFISTFMGFLNMFHLQDMTPQIKQQFYSSVSVCVTRSQAAPKHLNYFKRILKQINDPKLILERKQELIHLVQYIIRQNRIEAFQAAQIGKNASKCQMVEIFDKMGWEFLNIADAQTKMKKGLINLPFKKDYDILAPDQKKLVDEVIAKRVNSYVQFSKILNTLIRSIEFKWNICLQKWRNQNQFDLDLKNYEELFDAVKLFLDQNDAYESEKLVSQQAHLENTTPLNLIKTIRKVLYIYSIADQIGDQQGSFMDKMKSYAGLFEKFIQCMGSFASSLEHQRYLQRLSFIIKRGFRQFSKLYQINQIMIHAVSQKMKDNCQLIFSQIRKQFIQQFIMPIDSNLMRKLFAKIDDLAEYQEFFIEYQSRYKQDLTNTSFISQHKNDIQIIKANLFITDGKKDKAIRSNIRSFRTLCEIGAEVQRSNKSQDQIDSQLNQIYIKKLFLLGKITSELVARKDIETTNYALTICKHTKNIHQACQIYEIVINQTEDHALKLQKIGEFADYCLEWGRYEKATTLLQKKLYLERQNFANYMQTIKKMQIVSKEQIRYLQTYQNSLQNWSRLNEQDKQLDSYLQELELIIPDQ